MKFFIVLSTLGILAALPAQAQQVDQAVMAHAKNVAGACVGNWESAGCIEAMGKSNKDLAINYAETLNAQGHKASLDAIKNGCAAATVEEKGEFPATAFGSAYVECVNTIYDTTTKTSVMPDQSHYQLLVAGGLCITKDPRCNAFEEQMKNW
ncbi:MAG: hypothetical protein ACLFR0_02250 [Alphaproteobacteria bacterium]